MNINNDVCIIVQEFWYCSHFSNLIILFFLYNHAPSSLVVDASYILFFTLKCLANICDIKNMHI